MGTVISFVFRCNFRMQNLYGNFLHENFCTRSNYSNRTVIHVNYTKIFLHENFYHENKANYGSNDHNFGIKSPINFK